MDFFVSTQSVVDLIDEAILSVPSADLVRSRDVIDILLDLRNGVAAEEVEELTVELSV